MLAITDSQARTVMLAELLSDKGIHCEPVSTPKQYSKYGCSYSVRFDAKDINAVKRICIKNNITVKFV